MLYTFHYHDYSYREIIGYFILGHTYREITYVFQTY